MNSRDMTIDVEILDSTTLDDYTLGPYALSGYEDNSIIMTAAQATQDTEDTFNGESYMTTADISAPNEKNPLTLTVYVTLDKL